MTRQERIEKAVLAWAAQVNQTIEGLLVVPDDLDTTLNDLRAAIEAKEEPCCDIDTYGDHNPTCPTEAQKIEEPAVAPDGTFMTDSAGGPPVGTPTATPDPLAVVSSARDFAEGVRRMARSINFTDRHGLGDEAEAVVIALENAIAPGGALAEWAEQSALAARFGWRPDAMAREIRSLRHEKKAAEAKLAAISKAFGFGPRVEIVDAVQEALCDLRQSLAEKTAYLESRDAELDRCRELLAGAGFGPNDDVAETVAHIVRAYDLKQAKLAEVSAARDNLNGALAEMTSKYRKTFDRLVEVEKERGALKDREHCAAPDCVGDGITGCDCECRMCVSARESDHIAAEKRLKGER